MNIPDNIDNYIDFYQKCQAKGIKLISRYAGVHITVKNSGIAFKVVIVIKGKKVSKYLPFTREGEIHAANMYNTMRNENPTNMRDNRGNTKQIKT